MARFHVAVALSASLALFQGTALDRVIPKSVGIGEPLLTMPMPRNQEQCERAIRRVAAAGNVSFGWEVKPNSATRDEIDVLTIAGKTVRSILGEWSQACPGYKWSADAEFLSLVPTNSVQSVLDASVASFNLRDQTLEQALVALHDLGPIHDKSIQWQPKVSKLLAGFHRQDLETQTRYEKQDAQLSKRFSLSVRQTTLRRVLDGIVKAHGGAYWIFRPEMGRAGASFSIVLGVVEGAQLEVAAR